MKKLDGSQVFFSSLVTTGSTCQYVIKQFLLGDGNFLSIAKVHMPLGALCGTAALVAGISCRQVTRPEFLFQLYTIFFFNKYHY